MLDGNKRGQFRTPNFRLAPIFRHNGPMELEAFELVMLRRPAEADPAVRAGRLVVEIMSWYCPSGTMTQPGRPVTV